ncbi:unnamed protein product [Parnassius mnemosyne]|uniref:Uncharacterized protein n=1 Tax=Parnassius mnemosyne TaxID=213953 RepID=A0AAV1L4D9_9NEOP
MPKRSAQSKLEHYARKIRKIKEKEIQRRRIRPLQLSSSEDEGTEDLNVTVGNNNEPIVEPISVLHDISHNVDPVPDDNQRDGYMEPCPQEETNSSAEPELDPDLLSALGESTSDSPDYGDDIHGNLSQLWLPLLKKGMPIPSKDILIKDYPIPDNCRLLQAPKLNAEISAAVPDMVRNRAKTLTASQQQLGTGITAINRGMDLLLKSDNKVLAMKHLSNGCRLLCDSHYLTTQARVKLITPSLDKAFLNIVKESERDESLFGSSLSEKIKAAKAIEKQGLSIKKPAKTAKPPQQPSAPSRRPYTSPAQPPQRAAAHDKPRAPAQSHR